MLFICKNKFKYLEKVDMFGKEATLYYKGNEKKSSCFGTVFSLIFIILYVSFLIFKIKRMINKEDVLFYDTFTYMERPPSIKISKDNFYGGFSLENPITYDPFIDESIYYPKAYFKRAHRVGDKFIFDIKEVELERCKIENFGEKFQDKIIHHAINNLYCFKEVDEILEGHFSYGIYSFFYVEFFPCKNSSENNNACKPLEEIDYYLNNTFICFEMEDVQLTPENYHYPVLPRNKDIYFTVGKKLFQEIHVFFQLVYIETDLDAIGFEQYKSFKVDEFLRYDSQVQMTNLLENNIYKTGEAFCAVTLKLSDIVRIQKRSYSSLISVLGDVGGVMEFVFTLFSIISSFVATILYELSIVNKLFKYNIQNKTITIIFNNSNIESKYRINNKNINRNKFNSQYKMISNSLTPLNQNKMQNIQEPNYTDFLRYSKMKIIPKK